jgi:hypothetical protein
LFSLLFCLGFNDVIRFPAFAIALFCSVLREIEKAITFGLFTAPAQNYICSESEELTAYFDEQREDNKQFD